MVIPTNRLSWVVALGSGVLGLGLGWFGAVFGALGGFVLGELFLRLWTPFQIGRMYSTPDRKAPSGLVEGCWGAGVLGFSWRPPSRAQVLEFSAFMRHRGLGAYVDDFLEKYGGTTQEQLQ